MFCRNCGTEMPVDSRFCARCGAATDTDPAATPDTAPSSAPVQVADKRSYRWAIVAGWFIITVLLWGGHLWALAILASIVFWPLLLWAIIASAVASGVRRGRGI